MMSGRDPVRLGNRTYRAWGKPELPKNLFKTHETAPTSELRKS